MGFIDEARFSVLMRVNYVRFQSGTPATQVVTNMGSRNISIYCTMNKLGTIYYLSRAKTYNADRVYE